MDDKDGTEVAHQPHDPKRRRTTPSAPCAGDEVESTHNPTPVSTPKPDAYPQSVAPLTTETRTTNASPSASGENDPKTSSSAAPSTTGTPVGHASDHSQNPNHEAVPTTDKAAGTQYPGTIEPRPPLIGHVDGPKKYDPQVYLFCFPGGGRNYTDFKKWDALMGPNIQVCPVELPGHFSRYSEPLILDIEPLAKGIASAMINFLDRPYAFFGHSFGTLVAFEVLREMRRMNPELAEPLAMFVSARKAPHVPDPDTPEERLTLIEDPMKYAMALCAKYDDQALKKLITEKPGAVSTLIAVVRADNTVADRYEYHADDLTPFHCPIHPFIGEKDGIITAEKMTSWQRHTIHPLIGPTVFEGPHHFLMEDDIAQKLVSMIEAEIQEQYDQCGFDANNCF
ncbi:medium-chain acyl-[acyl-carrier-protein] hydrolase [Pelomyxa schiedti]|nr:medium-chain acyl-[acyl-carrier-protein] hydrolase [Pelomyxa schiedti]